MTPEQQQQAVEAALEADREASLRDMFAASALGAIISRGSHGMRYMELQAACAYGYADAMMKARRENS